MLTFANPEYFLFLIFVPLAGIFLWLTGMQRQRSLEKLGESELIKSMNAEVNQNGRWLKMQLWFLVLVLLVIALTRPQWGNEVHIVEQEGLQIMFALDVSSSMLAADTKPDRLSQAKIEIIKILERLGGDEVGLVLFSGASFIQFPLTNDYATARSLLEGSHPRVISLPGTAIAESIRIASTGFDTRRASQKMIILLSDGEDHEAGVLEATKSAVDQDIIVYSLGFGTLQGAPIPVLNRDGEITGFKKDAQGEYILTRLNEPALQTIAQTGNGKYWRAGTDWREVETLIADLGRFKRETIRTQFETQKIERFQLFVLLALGAFIISLLIPDRVLKPKTRQRSRGKSVKVIISLLVTSIMIFSSSCSTSPQRVNNLGNQAFNQGDYTTALQAYQQAIGELPNHPGPLYNQANTIYRMGDKPQAITNYLDAISLSQNDLTSNGYYNLGNAYFSTQQFEEAAEAYKEALRINPQDMDAKHNLELTIIMLKTQKEMENQTLEQSPPQDAKEPSEAQPQHDQTQPEGISENQILDGEVGAGKLSEEQARQLLDSAAQGTVSLEEYLQKMYPAGGKMPEKDW